MKRTDGSDYSLFKSKRFRNVIHTFTDIQSRSIVENWCTQLEKLNVIYKWARNGTL